MIRKILQIALNDLRVSFREGGLLIFMVLVPGVLVIGVALANGAFAGSNPTVPSVLLDVVDHDQSAASAQLLQTMRGLKDELVLCPMDTASEAGDAVCRMNGADLTPDVSAKRLNDGVADGYLEIPSGYGDALAAGQSVDLIYRSDAELGEADPALQIIQVATQRVSASLIAQEMGDQVAQNIMTVEDADETTAFRESIYTRASDIWATNPISVAFSQAEIDTQAADSATTTPGFRQSVPGMGSMYVMFTVLAATSVFINERKTWTLQRLMTMPVTGGEFIAGKMLSRFALGMMQYAVVFGIGLIFAQFLGFNFGSSPLALILVMAAFVICICGMALLLATFVRNDEQAGSVTTLLALILAPIGGAWWSLQFEFIPEIMRQISWLSPIRWAMDGFGQVIYEGGGVMSVLPYVGVLILAGIIMGGIAARRFDFGE